MSDVVGQCQNPGCNDAAKFEVRSVYEYGSYGKPKAQTVLEPIGLCGDCFGDFYPDLDKRFKEQSAPVAKEPKDD